jgi:hypothetical protein
LGHGILEVWFARTVVVEISKYNLDSVEIQEIRWERVGTEPAGECMYLYGNGDENHELGTGFLIRTYENFISSP